MADKEKISALMDGELIDKALISELSNDQDGLKVWRNYHLIGDVMRGDTLHSQWDIAEQVSLALENEPVHNQFDLAEKTEHLDITFTESQPSPAQARRQLPAWLGQLGQVAIAASVSLAVVVGVQQYGGSDSSNLAGHKQQLPVLQTIPLAGTAEPVSLTRESVQRQESAKRYQTETNVQEQRRRINAMLQDYELQLKLNSENSNHSSGH